MQTIKRGRGRPMVPESEKAKNRSIKMTDADWDKINRLAGKKNLTITEFIRQKVLQAQ